jgi:pimeloyl-ACP methyl ester carboxylesterase
MRLFYRKYGSGPPLVILHGLFGSSDNWVSFARSLSDLFTVYLPDQRNHGQSPHSEIHDYESMMKDLEELVNDLGLEKFFLAGHSMGGKTATLFAVNHPERLNGLLVADISPFDYQVSQQPDPGNHYAIIKFMLTSDLKPLKSRSEVDELLSRTIKSVRIRELILKNLKRESDNTFSWKLNPAAIHSNFDRIMKGVIRTGPGIIEITGFPVYFLKGELSDYLTEEAFPLIKRIFPVAEFIVIPGAGHWIHADNPESVRKCFLRFLDY